MEIEERLRKRTECYCTRENFMVSYSPEFFLANIHRYTYTENVFGVCALTVAYLPNFSLPLVLPVWFTKVFPCQNFLMYSIML